MKRPPQPSPLEPAAAGQRGRDTLRRDCAHRGAPHRHGTRAAYVSDRCGCIRCRAANRNAETRRIAAITAGTWAPYTDSTPVHQHITALRQHGIGLHRIAHLSSVPIGTVRRLARQKSDSHPKSQRVRTATASRLLAVPLTTGSGSPRQLVPADDTRRRITELTATGHTIREVARLLGKTPSTLRRSLSRRFVTAGTADAIATLHATLTDHARQPALHPEAADQSPAVPTVSEAPVQRHVLVRSPFHRLHGPLDHSAAGRRTGGATRGARPGPRHRTGTTNYCGRGAAAGSARNRNATGINTFRPQWVRTRAPPQHLPGDPG